MKAAELSSRCIVEAREAGAWVERGAVWALIEPRTSAGATSFDGAPPARTFRVVVRAPHPLAPGMRLSSGDLALRVLTRAPPEAGFIELHCEEDRT
jgi:head-tail adaptor